MSFLVANPEDRSSRDEAQMYTVLSEAKCWLHELLSTVDRQFDLNAYL